LVKAVTTLRNVQRAIQEYRNQLYEEIVKRKKALRRAQRDAQLAHQQMAPSADASGNSRGPEHATSNVSAQSAATQQPVSQQHAPQQGQQHAQRTAYGGSQQATGHPGSGSASRSNSGVANAGTHDSVAAHGQYASNSRTHHRTHSHSRQPSNGGEYYTSAHQAAAAAGEFLSHFPFLKAQ
jgi:hypothetical protein